MEIYGILPLEKNQVIFIHSTHPFMLSSLKEAFSNSDELILITDEAVDPSDASILFANKAFLEFTGFCTEELKSLATVQSPDIDPQTLASYMETRRTREPFDGMLIGEKKSGEMYWVDLTVVPYHDLQSEQWYFVHKPKVADK